MVSVKSYMYNVSELEVGDNTTIDGHILELSPIKKSINKHDYSYFNGKLSEDIKVVRFVSFESKLCLLLDLLRKEKKAVALSSC